MAKATSSKVSKSKAPSKKAAKTTAKKTAKTTANTTAKTTAKKSASRTPAPLPAQNKPKAKAPAPDRPPDAAPRPEAPQGLSASVSRVFNAPVSVVYNEWSTAPRRRRWAADAMLSVRKATQNKSMRITWDADATEVDVTFTSQGPEKCLVVVDHSKLRSPARAAELKAFWGEAMERLKALVVKA